MFNDLNIFELLALNSIMIIGLWQACKEGMILGFIRDYIKEDSTLATPVYLCPTCMASIHSLPFFVLSDISVFIYPIYILALAGVNSIVTNIVRFDE